MNEKARRDWSSVALTATLGLVTVVGGIRYGVGTLDDMGPGYFPLILGGALLALSVTLGLKRAMVLRGRSGDPELRRRHLRAWTCITAGIVAFIVLGGHGGLVPATFALVLLSALGDRKNGLRDVLLTAAAVTFFAVVLFHYAMGLQFPLFTWG